LPTVLQLGLLSEQQLGQLLGQQKVLVLVPQMAWQ
jgi:hypothetical protein